MQSDHQPFVVKRGPADVLLFYIHGILGSPLEFRKIIEPLEIESIHGKAILLPGHGGSGKNFVRSNLSAWINHVQHELESARKEYSKIYLMGHSLGGLLAIKAAMDNPIKGIVLLNTPLKTWINFRQISLSFKVIMSPGNSSDPIVDSYRRTFSVSLKDWWTLPLWLNRMLDVPRMAHNTLPLLKKIKVPVYVYQSIQDETVNPISAEILKNSLGNNLFSLTYLQQSTHAYFVEAELNKILKGIKELLQN